MLTEIQDEIDMDNHYWSKYQRNKETENIQCSKERNILMGIRETMNTESKELNQSQSPLKVIDRMRTSNKIYKTLEKNNKQNHTEYFTSRIKINKNQLVNLLNSDNPPYSVLNKNNLVLKTKSHVNLITNSISKNRITNISNTNSGLTLTSSSSSFTLKSTMRNSKNNYNHTHSISLTNFTSREINNNLISKINSKYPEFSTYFNKNKDNKIGKMKETLTKLLK